MRKLTRLFNDIFFKDIFFNNTFFNVTYFALFVVFALLQCTFQNQAAAQTFSSNTPRLKFMTLNFNAETDNTTLMLDRLAVLENYISQNSIDVIFIQECWSLNNKTAATLIADDLNLDSIYHMEDGVSGVRVTSVCMITQKYLQMKNPVYFKLPHSALTVGNGQDTWISFGETNMLVGATVTLPNGEPGFLWTAHLTDGSDADRLDQIKFAQSQMESAVEAVGLTWEKAWTFFGGDFNTTPDTAAIQYLRDDFNYQDTWLLSHPGDEGRTFVAVPSDSEYNPMSHASGLFPSQAVYQETGRFDYFLVHGPQTFSTGITRIFTSPVNRVWMSDHGMAGVIDFSGTPVTGFPSADTNMASLGAPTTLNITDSLLNAWQSQENLSVTSLRGFTVTNTPSVETYVSFQGIMKSQVYPASDSTLWDAGEIVSFAFFACGNYPYSIQVSDYRDKNGNVNLANPPKVKTVSGTLQVQ